MALIYPSPVKSETLSSETVARDVTKTDLFKTIHYVDTDFCIESNLRKLDYFVCPNRAIIHADLPKTISKRIWFQIYSQKYTPIIIKSPTLQGAYQWVIMDIMQIYDQYGNLDAFLIRRSMPCRDTIARANKLYKRIKAIELSMGIEVAEIYFTHYLKDRKQTFDMFTTEICSTEIEKHNNYSKNTLDNIERNTESLIMV